MAAIIAPAILTSTLEAYTHEVERLSPFAERVHIDITDGKFAEATTVGVGDLHWPENWQVDIHAMVEHPSEYVEALVARKPYMIIFHAEADEDLVPVLQQVRQAGVRVGVALLRGTVPKTVAHYIELADHVMIFSGNLGEHGGTASLMQLEKVRLIRMIRPTVEVGWDGGANVGNVFSLSQGDVDVINVGGAISNADDPAEMYKKIVAEAGRRSVL